MSRYANLLSPITIKGRTFKNRVFSSAHAPGYAENGQPDERYQAYHEAKAKGGLGLTMFGGSSNVSRDSGSIYGQIYVGDDQIVPVFREFANRLHRHDTGIMCQITHMGRRTTWDAGDWLPTKGPSARRDPAHHSAPYEISTREIARIVGAFANAARRCREGGLDGVEILGSSHILGQFLSPLSNFRDDDYGGTLENRMRFLLQVLEACREAVGDEFIISFRGNFDESNEDGLSVEDGIEIARRLGSHGVVDILNVNGAYGGTDMGLTEYMPGMAFPAAPYVELARRVRNASGLPTFQAARLSDPATADWAVGEGYVDMAGMTRPHMADPEIVAKLSRGEEDRIRPCVGAGYCLDRIYAGREAFCQHNVSTGRETWLPEAIPRAPTPLKAVVVGGGPAGMEAARVLRLRGHSVTLFEATDKLGGQVRLAGLGSWRKDMIGTIDWLASELGHLEVVTHTNTYAEALDVEACNPDIVIIASGGVPETRLPEGGDELVLSVWDALGNPTRISGEVLIFDAVGGHAALSLADRLSADGANVFVATPDRHLGRAIGGQNVPIYMRNLAQRGVSTLTDRVLQGVRSVGNRKVALFRHTFSREISEVPADTVIADLGTASALSVFEELVPRSKNLGEMDHEALATLSPQPIDANERGRFQLFRIGDAYAPRDQHAALLDANRLCRVL